MPFFKQFKIVLIITLSLILFLSFKDRNPKVFVIGDSISIHYGSYLKNSLNGFFNYERKGEEEQVIKDLDIPSGTNGGDSEMVLAYLKELKTDSNFKTDYLLVNCGLHDIKRKSPSDSTQISIKKYGQNLQSIINISKQMNVKLVWVKSTPVVDTIHNRKAYFYRFNKDVISYNKLADSIMLATKTPIIDLYTFTKKYGPSGYIDHVHYKTAIREKQADFIAGNLIAILNCNFYD